MGEDWRYWAFVIAGLCAVIGLLLLPLLMDMGTGGGG